MNLSKSPLPVIDAQNLHIAYKLGKTWHTALHDISLTIPPLELHGLVGESGSGKSTLGLALMRYLASNARIDSGRILLDGVDLVPKSDAELRGIWGNQLSLVPQNPLASLNPSYSVGEQIAEITRHHTGATQGDAWAQAVEMLRSVKIADAEIVARRYPHQLSGGMRQRVAIAMALSTQPRLLVLDEPTTALDVTTQAVILDLFRDLIRSNNAAALYVSHDLGTVAQLCDRVTVLYGGEVMETASVRTIYQHPLHPYTAGLLASLPRPHTSTTETRLPTIDGVAPGLAQRPHGCAFAARCRVSLSLCFEQKPPLDSVRDDDPTAHRVRCHRWREIASGSLVLTVPPQPAAPVAPPRPGYVLQAQAVYKQFDESRLFDRLLRRRRASVKAVDGVSLRVNGRSTRASVVLPLELTLRPRNQDQLCNLQMVFQNPNDSLNPYRTVGQALARTIRRLDGRQKTRIALDARVAELLSAVRLPAEYAARYPGELSGGEKQRVAIARAFAANPAMILADEPTSSLDVSVQAVILNLLKDLRAQQGASYILISHD
ncbi:MAG: ABC transporter ATP-binding protein, partial [Armatimonadetes bacterium]|nr:ABC transporter ATP-binding protein [Anaerolineae bacterium]